MATPMPTPMPMRRGVVLTLHVGYWGMYLLLLLLLFGVLRAQARSGPNLFAILFASRVGFQLIVPNVVSFYLAYLVLVPRFLARRRFGALAIGSVAGALLASVVSLLGLVGVGRATGAIFFPVRELIGFTIVMSGMALIHMTLATVIRGFVGWYDDIAVKDTLRRRTADIEAALVRATLDPHFLFNTLNNIDTLISRDPGAASQYLNHLSGMLRYVLYDARAARVPLEAELKFVEQYITLQRLRVRNPAIVSYTVTGERTGRLIAPMLLVPFVENAFKHASGERGDDAIAIRVDVQYGTLTFTCRNRYSPTSASTSSTPVAGGLGNDLMHRRLELLYPSRHTLRTDHDSAVYDVNLVVRMDSSHDDALLAGRP